MKYCCDASGWMSLNATTVAAHSAPGPTGVPVISPVYELMLKPVGQFIKLKVGAGTPVAVTWNEYGCPTVPLGGVPEVIVGALKTDIVYGALAGVPILLFAVTVNE